MRKKYSRGREIMVHLAGTHPQLDSAIIPESRGEFRVDIIPVSSGYMQGERER